MIIMILLFILIFFQKYFIWNILEIKNSNQNIEEKKSIISIDSDILKIDEFDMINTAIQKRMKKEIKEIKKIYQATKDGGSPSIFHKKCDNIPNTLVLYKSAGKRRFGGFTSKCWNSSGQSIMDKDCFLFSLDSKKIYYKNNNEYYFLERYYSVGPSFSDGLTYIIEIKDALKNETLKTNEQNFFGIFGEDKNALSEDGIARGIYAEEYELFQIIFY